MIKSKIKKVIDLQNEIAAIAESIKDVTPKSPEIEALKKQRKELTKNIKDLQADLEYEMENDDELLGFREKKVLKEEELAEATNAMFDEFKKTSKEFTVDVQTDEGMAKAQGVTIPHLYINGKEIKNRAYQQRLF